SRCAELYCFNYLGSVFKWRRGISVSYHTDVARTWQLVWKFRTFFLLMSQAENPYWRNKLANFAARLRERSNDRNDYRRLLRKHLSEACHAKIVCVPVFSTKALSRNRLAHLVSIQDNDVS